MVTVDKAELMMRLLDQQQVKYRPTFMGWQTISCPNTNGHVHGDKNPSARVNLTHGSFACMGCGMKGDAYSMVMTMTGCDFKTALESIGEPLSMSDDGFII